MSTAVWKTSFLRSCAAVSLMAATLIGASPTVAQKSTPAANQELLRFGLVLPLSGSQAFYGQDQVQAAEWAVEKINADGGVNGRPLKMIVLDSRADPQVGMQAAKRLTSVEHVPVFISGFSSVVKAVAPVANDAHVVQCVGRCQFRRYRQAQ